MERIRIRFMVAILTISVIIAIVGLIVNNKQQKISEIEYFIPHQAKLVPNDLNDIGK